MLSSILTSVLVGLLSTGSPCVFPLYPGFLAFISGGQAAAGKKIRFFLGFFVLGGVLVMMLLLGLVIALLSVSVGSALSILVPLADLALVVLGALLLVNINPFKSLPQVQAPVLKHPFASAFAYGFLYGPIALPCSGPLVVSIFALSLNAGEFLSKLAVFLWFGIGFGLPLLLLSFMAGAAQHWITRQFALHSRLINAVSGLLLVGVGVYDFTQNFDLIRSYLAL